jgi:hypothetical protein
MLPNKRRLGVLKQSASRLQASHFGMDLRPALDC